MVEKAWIGFKKKTIYSLGMSHFGDFASFCASDASCFVFIRVSLRLDTCLRVSTLGVGFFVSRVWGGVVPVVIGT